MIYLKNRTVGFAPTDISGLFVWIDASDTSTITHSSGSVSQINDKSGNGRHFTQSTGSLQPVTGVETLNGLNVLDFPSSDKMEWTLSSASRSDPWTVFMVVKSIAKGRVNLSLGSNNGFAPVTWDEFDKVGFLIGGLIWSGTGPHISNWVIHTTTSSYSGSTATMAALINGSTYNTYSGSMNEMSGKFWLNGDSAGAMADAHMAEVIIYKATLTTDERAAVHSYLNAKWAVY